VPQDFLFCGKCGHRLAQASKAAAAAPTASPAAQARMVLIRPDGTEGGSLALNEGETLVGRGQHPLFDGDAYLSPRHAALFLVEGALLVRDLTSLNGVFMKMAAEEELFPGDLFRIGQELLRFDALNPPAPLDDGTEVMGSPNPGYWGRLSVVVGRDVDGSAYPLFGEAVVLGRERGDILFPDDGYVSGTHARIMMREGRFFLSDLGSSNGTFMRVRSEQTVQSGAFLLMGQQLFRVQFS
jgi:pSer/pThr/pTyr-binding forkhead associated (FHA) protein